MREQALDDTSGRLCNLRGRPWRARGREHRLVVSPSLSPPPTRPAHASTSVCTSATHSLRSSKPTMGCAPGLRLDPCCTRPPHLPATSSRSVPPSRLTRPPAHCSLASKLAAAQAAGSAATPGYGAPPPAASPYGQAPPGAQQQHAQGVFPGQPPSSTGYGQQQGQPCSLLASLHREH